jgi:hypothetical protein
MSCIHSSFFILFTKEGLASFAGDIFELKTFPASTSQGDGVLGLSHHAAFTLTHSTASAGKDMDP